jgi:hypothetical protein
MDMKGGNQPIEVRIESGVNRKDYEIHQAIPIHFVTFLQNLKTGTVSYNTISWIHTTSNQIKVIKSGDMTKQKTKTKKLCRNWESNPGFHGHNEMS